MAKSKNSKNSQNSKKRTKRLKKYQSSRQLNSKITEGDKKFGKQQIYFILALVIIASLFVFYNLATRV